MALKINVVVQILHWNMELRHPVFPVLPALFLEDETGGQGWDFVTSLQRHPAAVGDRTHSSYGRTKQHVLSPVILQSQAYGMS